MAGRAVWGGVVLVGLLASTSGCVKHYWGKPGASLDDFTRDSEACTREAAPTPEAARYGIIVQDVYRACLRGRGWARDTQYDPPPGGWYRGIE